MSIATNSWNYKNKFQLKLPHAEYQLRYRDVPRTPFSWEGTTQTANTTNSLLTDIFAYSTKFGITTYSLLVVFMFHFFFFSVSVAKVV